MSWDPEKREQRAELLKRYAELFLPHLSPQQRKEFFAQWRRIIDARLTFNAKIRIRTLSNHERVRRTEDEFWGNAQRIADNLNIIQMRDEGTAEWAAERSQESAERFVALIEQFDENLTRLERLGKEFEEALNTPHSSPEDDYDIDVITEAARQINENYVRERMAAARSAKNAVNKLLRFVPLRKLVIRWAPAALHMAVSFGVLSYALGSLFECLKPYVHKGVFIGLLALYWALIEYVAGPWLSNLYLNRRLGALNHTANEFFNTSEQALMNVYANAAASNNHQQ